VRQVSVFKIAFNCWISEASQATLPQIIRQSFEDLKTVTAGK